MGNFVVVWGGLLALAICAWKFLRSFVLAEGLVTLFYAVKPSRAGRDSTKAHRLLLLLPAAMFLGVAIASVLSRAHSPRIFGIRMSVLVLVAAAVFFLYCLPRMAGLESPYDCIFGCWT
jgi:hypothetical protein